MPLQTFTAQIPDDAIADVKARLRNARYIEDTFGGWPHGVTGPFVKALCEHWLHKFDWRALERRINGERNHICEIDKQAIHLLHKRSTRPDAIPLLLIHGWPGSFLEFLDVCAPLAEPSSSGPAFHVIIPSLPGYGFSGKPTRPGMNPQAIAKLFVGMMSELGYPRFIVQGGDWGSMIATDIARNFPDRCLGLHLNMVGGSPPENASSQTLSRDEQAWVADFKRFQTELSGYFAIQSTKPATPAYALNDSPAGLAAWIGEKFYYWTDRRDNDQLTIPLDKLIGNIALYWFTGTIGSSMRLYYEYVRAPAEEKFVTVPTGGAIFPKELVKLPKPWAEKRYNLVHWSVFDRGGHFAAMEAPDLFMGDIRKFASTLSERGLLNGR